MRTRGCSGNWFLTCLALRVSFGVCVYISGVAERVTIRFAEVTMGVNDGILTHGSNALSIAHVSTLMSRITRLHGTKIRIVLVSSKTMTSKHDRVGPSGGLSDIRRERLFSTIKRTGLVGHCCRLFHRRNVPIKRILAAGRDFNAHHRCLGRHGYVVIVLRGNIVPVMGRGSAVSIARLVFASGSRLSKVVTSVVSVRTLVVLDGVSNVCGNSPSAPNARIVQRIRRKGSLSSCVRARGSKFNQNNVLAGAAVTHGITSRNVAIVVTGNGGSRVLISLLRRPTRAIYAHFVPTRNKMSDIGG